MHHDLDIGRIELVVSNGFGGCVEGGRDVVFDLDVDWYVGCGVFWWRDAFLNVAFEDGGGRWLFGRLASRSRVLMT